VEDPSQFAEQLFLCTVCRLPDEEEQKMVREMLSHHAEERGSLVQELVWSVLASGEFRFIP
jgi:hypothetical protein